jgi:hypothetical protein
LEKQDVIKFMSQGTFAIDVCTDDSSPSAGLSIMYCPVKEPLRRSLYHVLPGEGASPPVSVSCIAWWGSSSASLYTIYCPVKEPLRRSVYDVSAGGDFRKSLHRSICVTYRPVMKPLRQSVNVVSPGGDVSRPLHQSLYDVSHSASLYMIIARWGSPSVSFYMMHCPVSDSS